MKKLLTLQSELKAPKAQKAKNYKYRSCEDIVEAVKPIASKLGLILNLSDEIQQIGDRYYIKATATITDIETGEEKKATAYAREPQSNPAMNESQITGAASSYARKYALNGLLAIDDTKDPDTDEYTEQQSPEKGKGKTKEAEAVAKERKSSDATGQNAFDMSKVISADDQKELIALLTRKGLGANDIVKVYGVPIQKLTDKQFAEAVKRIMALPDKEAQNDIQEQAQ